MASKGKFLEELEKELEKKRKRQGNSNTSTIRETTSPPTNTREIVERGSYGDDFTKNFFAELEKAEAEEREKQAACGLTGRH